MTYEVAIPERLNVLPTLPTTTRHSDASGRRRTEHDGHCGYARSPCTSSEMMRRSAPRVRSSATIAWRWVVATTCPTGLFGFDSTSTDGRLSPRMHLSCGQSRSYLPFANDIGHSSV